MFFLVFISCTCSRRFEQIFNSTDPTSTKISGYDDAYLIFEPGQALMMVEWEDAILTFFTGSDSCKMTKHAGFSFFTFAEKTDILINFHSPISFFTLHSPYIKSLDGAIQIISNINENQIPLSSTSKDIYLSIYSPYDLLSSLTTSVLGQYTLHYYTNSSQTSNNINYVKSANLSDINYVTIFQSRFGSLKGTFELNNLLSYTPTIPTCIRLTFNSINSQRNYYDGNKAYGGSYLNNTNINKNLLEFNRTEYVFISHNFSPDDYNLFVNNSKGEITEIMKGELYSEMQNFQFSVDILVISSKCENYSFVETVNSSFIEITNNGYLQTYKITNDMISDECRVSLSKRKDIEKVGIIVSIVMAALVVAAVIIGLIVLLVVRVRRNMPSYKEEVDSDASNSPEEV